jgi:hypothetical protein
VGVAMRSCCGVLMSYGRNEDAEGFRRTEPEPERDGERREMLDDERRGVRLGGGGTMSRSSPWSPPASPASLRSTFALVPLRSTQSLQRPTLSPCASLILAQPSEIQNTSAALTLALCRSVASSSGSYGVSSSVRSERR